MQFKDYYAVMGVPRDATDAQVKQAYRKLARKYHPDVSKEADAEARFKELGEAYEVLRNPEKRTAYDRLSQHHRAGEEFRPPPDWDAGFEFSGSGPHAEGTAFSDFFESLFGAAAAQGRRPGRAGAQRGADHHAKVTLDLESSLSGGPRTLTLRVPEFDADGRPVARERMLNVQVPKGILAGQTIRLQGQGERPAAPPGATPGDLYLEVEFQPHPLYRVDGRDLYLDLPVTPWEAALGATVKSPTPSGPVDLRIPAGSKAGSRLRLRGRGMPATPPGDFFVVLGISLPPADDDAAKAAYRALAQALPFDPRAHLWR